MKTRWIIIVAAIASTITLRAGAETSVSGAAAVQMKKTVHQDKGNLDDAFIRAELKAGGTTEKGLEGLFHIRAQQEWGLNKDLIHADSTFKFYLRQAWFDAPMSVVKARAGRWYEKYSPGAYFGRFLPGLKKPFGSGAMKTNYTIVDGLRFHVPVEAIKTDFYLAELVEDGLVDNAYTMFRFETSSIEMLKLQAGISYKALADEDDPAHRAMAAFQLDIAEGFSLFAEYGNVDISDFDENSWFMGGVDIPTAGILSMCRVELEYHPARKLEKSADLAWMVILTKKVLGGLEFALNIGNDPAGLKSQEPGDIGAILRTTAKF